MRSRRLAAIALLSFLLLPVLTPAGGLAAPSIYSRVLQAYEAHGAVPPCQFSSAQLGAALKGVDTYGEQYFADFTEAIQNALAQRAAGACSPGGVASRGTGVAAAGSSGFIPPSVTGPTASNLPAPILILAALTLLAATAGAAVAILRATGREFRWAATVRHVAAEAGYRASVAWSELRDRAGLSRR